MSEHKESKRNFIVNYFQESLEELKKVTWPTRNQAIRLTFIVIGFCIVFSFVVGALDFAFNSGYRSLVNLSEKIAPPAATSPVTNQVATGEPTSAVDLSKIKVTPSAAPASDVKVTGSTQQK